jgi:hypothetical protein
LLGETVHCLRRPDRLRDSVQAFDWCSIFLGTNLHLWIWLATSQNIFYIVFAFACFFVPARFNTEVVSTGGSTYAYPWRVEGIFYLHT